MANNRWSNKKLNQLADLVEVLAIQVQQLQSQVERTCDRVDQLTEVMRQTLPTPPHSARPEQMNDHSNDRINAENLAQIETRLDQIDRRVKALERQALTTTSLAQPAVVEALDEEDIEDEPDEILWDFLDPTERGR